MKIILNPYSDPYFNLAAEEYLLETADDDVFMLWRNSASVIIGKNQNAWAEVDTEFTEANGIPVVRRLTGGGAVFHDKGNVNFTFITDAPKEPQIDFSPFTLPILEALKALGIKAEADGRNDIIADGYKISGNAQCVYRCADGTRKLMHHGTLLYDADLSSLAGALRVNQDKLRSKGIRSVSSRVKNIRSIGSVSFGVEKFLHHLTDFAERTYNTESTVFTAEDAEKITAIANSKYSTWEWNYGNSPEFENMKTKRFPWGTLTASYNVRKGAVKNISLTGDFFGVEDVSALESALADCRFERTAVASKLGAVPIENIIAGVSVDDILDLLFTE